MPRKLKQESFAKRVKKIAAIIANTNYGSDMAETLTVVGEGLHIRFRDLKYLKKAPTCSKCGYKRG